MKEETKKKVGLTGVGLTSGTASAAVTNAIIKESGKEPDPAPEPIDPIPEPVNPTPEPIEPTPEPINPTPEPVDPIPEPVDPDIIDIEPYPIPDMYMPNIDPDIDNPDIIDPEIIVDPIDDILPMEFMYGGPTDYDIDDPLIDDEEGDDLEDDDSLLNEEDIPVHDDV